MKSDKELIAGCLKSRRKAQKQLYEKFAPKMIHVCRRYSNNRNPAEDVMQEGFIKVFNKIDQLKDSSKLDAWIKQIMITQSLMRLRKKENLVFYDDHSLEEKQDVEIFADESFQYNKSDLNRILEEMPKGYKVIFNMYVFDDYSHKEIAALLNISEGTSKSQLSRARNYLKGKLNQLKDQHYSRSISYGMYGSLIALTTEVL